MERQLKGGMASRAEECVKLACKFAQQTRRRRIYSCTLEKDGSCVGSMFRYGRHAENRCRKKVPPAETHLMPSPPPSRPFLPNSPFSKANCIGLRKIQSRKVRRYSDGLGKLGYHMDLFDPLQFRRRFECVRQFSACDFVIG